MENVEKEEASIDLKYKSFKEVITSILLGFFIGLSIIIPGISGTTIAIVMKVYDKLLYSFANLFKKFKLCFIFLLPIALGAILGFGIGLVIVKLLLERFPFPTICLFVGLMAGTYPIIHKEIAKHEINAKRVTLFTLGIILPIAISLISSFVSAERGLDNLVFWHYIMFFFIGVAISLTQIMPGLSATALLIVLGYYNVLLDSIGMEMFRNLNILLVFGVMIVGCVIGIVLFSNIIQRNLMHHRVTFFNLICGLSLGSMISVFTGAECFEVYRGLSASNWYGIILPGILTLLVGFTLTFMLYLYEKKHTKTADDLDEVYKQD